MAVRKIAVTGAAGQIAYSLIFRIAAGELFGTKTHITLHLLEIPQAMEGLKGVVMELEDCAFPLLDNIVIGSDPEAVFDGIDTAFLVGSKPRGPGMERKELLKENGPIFVGQGKALAGKGAVVLVVGNPCNTNCLIASEYAKGCRLFAMTRLDQNRAASMLAQKAGVKIEEVTNVTIWGNHSSTQVPDFLNAKIGGRAAGEVIRDRKWLEEHFVAHVQKRGAEVIAARGKSSAASAAQSALDAMRSLLMPTRVGEWFSVGLKSDGNPYGIAPGLIFSFPCISKGNGEVEIVKGLQLDPFLEKKIRLSEQELVEERSMVKG